MGAGESSDALPASEATGKSGRVPTRLDESGPLMDIWDAFIPRDKPYSSLDIDKKALDAFNVDDVTFKSFIQFVGGRGGDVNADIQYKAALKVVLEDFPALVKRASANPRPKNVKSLTTLEDANKLINRFFKYLRNVQTAYHFEGELTETYQGGWVRSGTKGAGPLGVVNRSVIMKREIEQVRNYDSMSPESKVEVKSVQPASYVVIFPDYVSPLDRRVTKPPSKGNNIDYLQRRLNIFFFSLMSFFNHQDAATNSYFGHATSQFLTMDIELPIEGKNKYESEIERKEVPDFHRRGLNSSRDGKTLVVRDYPFVEVKHLTTLAIPHENIRPVPLALMQDGYTTNLHAILYGTQTVPLIGGSPEKEWGFRGPDGHIEMGHVIVDVLRQVVSALYILTKEKKGSAGVKGFYRRLTPVDIRLVPLPVGSLRHVPCVHARTQEIEPGEQLYDDGETKMDDGDDAGVWRDIGASSSSPSIKEGREDGRYKNAERNTVAVPTFYRAFIGGFEHMCLSMPQLGSSLTPHAYSSFDATQPKDHEWECAADGINAGIFTLMLCLMPAIEHVLERLAAQKQQQQQQQQQQQNKSSPPSIEGGGGGPKPPPEDNNPQQLSQAANTEAMRSTLIRLRNFMINAKIQGLKANKGAKRKSSVAPSSASPAQHQQQQQQHHQSTFLHSIVNTEDLPHFSPETKQNFSTLAVLHKLFFPDIEINLKGFMWKTSHMCPPCAECKAKTFI